MRKKMCYPVTGFTAPLLVFIASLCGCQSTETVAETAIAEVEVAPVMVPAGTDVRMLLLQSVSSGGTRVGSKVQFVVADDVVVDGEVVVPMGSMAYGVIERSRGSTAATTMINQPARLDIKIEELVRVDGERVALAVDLENPDEALDMREVRGRSAEPLRGEFVKAEEDALRMLAQALDSGEGFDGLLENVNREALSSAARKMGYRSLQELAQPRTGGSDGFVQLIDLLDQAQSAMANPIIPSEAILMLRAVEEISRFAGGIDRWLRGTFKGRNIAHPIGTEVTVKIADDVMLKPIPRG